MYSSDSSMAMPAAYASRSMSTSHTPTSGLQENNRKGSITPCSGGNHTNTPSIIIMRHGSCTANAPPDQRSIDIQEFLHTIRQKEDKSSYFFPSFLSNHMDCDEKKSITSTPPSYKDVIKMYDRVEAVRYLFHIVDRENEEREIVQVTMNYFDRYLLHVLQTRHDHKMKSSLSQSSSSVPSVTSDTSPTCLNRTRRRKASTSSTETDTDSTLSTSSLPRIDNEHLSIVLLVCMDLAIKMYSPFSGQWSNVQRYQEQSETRKKEREQRQRERRARAQRRARSEIPLDGSFPTIPVSVLDPVPVPVPVSFSSSSSQSEMWEEEIPPPSLSEQDPGTPLYVGTSFASMIELLHKRVTRQEVASVQQEVLRALGFYLHPPTSTQIVRCVMGLFESYIPHQRLLLSSSRASTMPPTTCAIASRNAYWKILEKIGVCTMIQVELAMFDSQLANIKPSIVAVAALENAFHQILNAHEVKQGQQSHDCHGAERASPASSAVTAVTPPPYVRRSASRRSCGSSGRNPTRRQQLSSEMTRTLCHISQEIMGLSSYNDTADIYKARELLFHYWKENNPDMIRIDHFSFVPSAPDTPWSHDTSTTAESLCVTPCASSTSDGNERAHDQRGSTSCGEDVIQNLFPSSVSSDAMPNPNPPDTCRTFQPIPDGTEPDMDGMVTEGHADAEMTVSRHGATQRKRICRRNSNSTHTPQTTKKRSSPAHVATI